VTTPISPALGFGSPVDSSAIVRIEGVLADLVQPADYVRWEYLSRQRLLANRIADFRVHGPARVLDIGCGNGALSLTLSEAAGFDLIAMDILPLRTSAVQARKRSREPKAKLQVLLANAERGLPFRDETFDAVVATEVLEHLDNPVRMLGEVHRVLRPGGRFFMTTPNAEALPYRLLRFLPDSVVRNLAGPLTHEALHPELLHDPEHATTPSHPDEHRREGFTLSELESLGALTDLRVIRRFTYRIPLPDRLMNAVPRRFSRRLARFGTRPLPMGLQLYAEFERA